MTDSTDTPTAEIVNIADARTAREILASPWTPPSLCLGRGRSRGTDHRERLPLRHRRCWRGSGEADRTNGAHWRVAKAGKAGYRRPDMVPATGTATTPSTPAVPQGPPIGVSAIPDDLSIPAFLLRRPLPHVAESVDRLAA